MEAKALYTHAVRAVCRHDCSRHRTTLRPSAWPGTPARRRALEALEAASRPGRCLRWRAGRCEAVAVAALEENDSPAALLSDDNL